MNKKNTPPVNSSTTNNNKETISKAKANNAQEKKSNNTNTAKKPKGKKTAGVIAILILLGLIGASGYFIHSHEVKFTQKLSTLQNQLTQLSTNNNKFVDNEKFASLTNTITSLQLTNKQLTEEITQQEKNINEQQQSIAALQSQINNIDTNNRTPQATQPTDWLLAESDYLLNNALHKLIIDDDVETAIALLQVADETLAKIHEPQVIAVRSAINEDLKQLFAVNNVDQDAIMQHLSALANQIDNLMILGLNSDDKNNDVSDSIGDWKTNLSKNIDSFFHNFIKVTKRNAEDKELLAPNQDIYLRENIRLRLQIAIMAVPRQQNTLYHQSLDMVATWIRSYFDTTNPEVQQYLTTLDKLSQRSIYVNIPTKLKSLELLDQLLNKTPKKLQKIKLTTDKALNVDQNKEEIATNPQEDTEDTAKEETITSEPSKDTIDSSHHNEQQVQPAITEE